MKKKDCKSYCRTRITIITIITIAIIIGLIFFLNAILRVENKDIKFLEKHFNKIKKNKSCINYLRRISSIPVWRLSIVFSLLLTILASIIFLLINPYPFSFFLLGYFIILFLISFIIIYKLLGHFQWHYIMPTDYKGVNIDV